MLMLLYWTAHMDFPYIENVNSYLIDYHIVFAGVLVYLIVKHAGHVFGLDGWVAKLASSSRLRHCAGWSLSAPFRHR